MTSIDLPDSIDDRTIFTNLHVMQIETHFVTVEFDPNSAPSELSSITSMCILTRFDLFGVAMLAAAKHKTATVEAIVFRLVIQRLLIIGNTQVTDARYREIVAIDLVGHRINNIVDSKSVSQGCHWHWIDRVIRVFPRITHIHIEIDGHDKTTGIVADTVPLRRTTKLRTDLAARIAIEVPAPGYLSFLIQVVQHVHQFVLFG